MIMDIVVTLPKSSGGLLHLMEKIDADSAYWKMSRIPIKFQLKTDKVFFVAEGFETRTKQIKDLKSKKKWKRELGTLFIIGKKPK